MDTPSGIIAGERMNAAPRHLVSGRASVRTPSAEARSVFVEPCSTPTRLSWGVGDLMGEQPIVRKWTRGWAKRLTQACSDCRCRQTCGEQGTEDLAENKRSMSMEYGGESSLDDLMDALDL
jgi:hypothetical protein